MPDPATATGATYVHWLVVNISGAATISEAAGACLLSKPVLLSQDLSSLFGGFRLAVQSSIKEMDLVLQSGSNMLLVIKWYLHSWSLQGVEYT